MAKKENENMLTIEDALLLCESTGRSIQKELDELKMRISYLGDPSVGCINPETTKYLVERLESLAKESKTVVDNSTRGQEALEQLNKPVETKPAKTKPAETE